MKTIVGVATNDEETSSPGLKRGSIGKKKQSMSKLDAAAFSFADMFSFPADGEIGNTEANIDNKENSSTEENSESEKKFQSMKKSKKIFLKTSSFFHPKQTPLQQTALHNSSYSKSVKTNTGVSSSPVNVAKRCSSPALIKPRRSANRGILITEELISRVCKTTNEKESLPKKDYPETYCHQCRIKSSDSKTICHSDECKDTKYHGAYCGVCLNMWYGIDGKEALRNREWICLSCSNECECNLCRVKRGLGPLPKTIASTALILGFSSVKKYLKSNGRGY